MKIKDGFQGERAIILPPAIVRELETDPLGRQLHITDIGYYPHASHHYRERKQGISQYILIYCVDGRGWAEYRQERHSVSSGQFFIIPAFLPHAYGADQQNPWTIYWIHFKGEMAPIYSDSLTQPVTLSSDTNSRISERINIFEEILNTLQMGYSKENLHYAFSCLYYFLGSLKFLHNFRNSSNDNPQDLIERAIHFMQENLEKSLVAQDIADYLGYSYSHLSSLFVQRMGYSPFNYYLRLKIQQACHYLDFTNMKINQICHKIGIEDPYYVSRLFKQIIGVSPKAYRNHPKG